MKDADHRQRLDPGGYTSDDGVWFNSRAWIVTAHRVDAGL